MISGTMGRRIPLRVLLACAAAAFAVAVAPAAASAKVAPVAAPTKVAPVTQPVPGGDRTLRADAEFMVILTNDGRYVTIKVP